MDKTPAPNVSVVWRFHCSTFRTTKRGQPLYKGLNLYGRQCVLYLEVPLYYSPIILLYVPIIRDYVNGIGNRSREQYVCIERYAMAAHSVL